MGTVRITVTPISTAMVVVLVFVFVGFSIVSMLLTVVLVFVIFLVVRPDLDQIGSIELTDLRRR